MNTSWKLLCLGLCALAVFACKPQSKSGTPKCADVVCVPFDDCHLAGVCDSTSGLCSNPTKTDGSTCANGAGHCLAGSCQVAFGIGRTAPLPDAIVGHAYSVYVATTLALGDAGADAVTECSLSGNVPPGMTASPGALPQSGAAPYYCVLDIPSASGAGQYSFSLGLTDQSSPPKTTSSTLSLTIRADFAFTSTTLAEGVEGRTYGVQPLSQAIGTNIGTTQGGIPVGNGPLAACTLTSVTPSNPGLGVALDGTKTQCLLTSPGLTQAGTFSVTVSAIETPITDPGTGLTAVPAGSAVPAPTLPLVVNPPLLLSVNQGSLWPDAVTGRPYGSGAGCTGGACVPSIYTATGGLGGYVFPQSTPLSMPVGISCAPSGLSTYTCSAPPPGISAAPGPYSPSVAVTDSGNSATPPASAASDPSSSRVDRLNVNAELKVVAPTSVPTAVTGRRYGSGTGCEAGNCAPLTYALASGLGNYTLTGSSLATQDDAFACTLSSPSFLCSSTRIKGPGGSVRTLTFTGAETGNASTPGNVVVDTSKTLSINPEITVTPPGSVFTAVHGRAYGTGTGCLNGACVPLKYALANGLGNYTLTGSSLAALTDTFVCTLSSPVFLCSSVAISGLGGTVPTLTFVGAENGNASTPGNVVTDTSRTLTINPEMVVTPPAAVPTAVSGRAYGTGSGCSAGACQPLTYLLSQGLGNYAAAGSSLTDGGDTFALSFVSPTFMFSTTSVKTSGGGTTTLTFTGAETGNTSTPGNAVRDTSKTFSVNAPLSVSVSIGGTNYPATSPWPVGVNQRPYGTGSGCTGGGACVPPVYTASGGLGGYTFTNVAGLTGMGFACTLDVPAPNSTKLTCTATSPAAGTPSVTAIDTPNVSTPVATTSSDRNSILTSTLTVNPEITILNPFMENATIGEPYSATFDSGAAGGPPCTWAAPSNCAGVGLPYTWSVPSGAMGTLCFVNTPSTTPGGCPSSSLPFGNPSAPADDPSLNVRGYYQGTLLATSTNPGTYPITVQVADGGNATTPACTTSATCPSLALTGAIAPKVFGGYGFVATNASLPTDQGDRLFAFDWNSSAEIFALKLDVGGSPVTPRVTPDGQWVYVTEAGSKQVAVVDPLHPSSLARTSIQISNTSGTLNPRSLDIEPQQYFTANPTTCTGPCSNFGKFIRYDAWIADPSVNIIEPIPEAEDPGSLPSTLAGGNAQTLSNANRVAVSGTDPTQAFVSQGACGAPPMTCQTLAVLTLPSLSPTTPTTYPASVRSEFQNGLRGDAVVVDPRGQFVAAATTSSDGTIAYVTVRSTGYSTSFVTYIPATSGQSTYPTTNVCSASGSTYSPVMAAPVALAVSPDGDRLFVACRDLNTPQVNNTLTIWDTSNIGGGIPFVQSLALPASSGTPVNSENGCTTPVDVKAKLTRDSSTSSYGVRLFVSCQDSDTIVSIDYNTGFGSTARDSYASHALYSTDPGSITNASIGNTTAAYTNYPCGHGGSCPQLLDLEPNPSLHFSTGGYAPTLPVALPAATHGKSYAYSLTVQGGAVPWRFSTPSGTDPLGTEAGACLGLMLDPSSGTISGAPTTSGTCGPFTTRATDASGQFVERVFTILVK